MGLVWREVEGREGWRVGVVVAQGHYNFSFVMEEIKVEKCIKHGKGKREKKNGTRRGSPWAKQGSWQICRDMDHKSRWLKG
jgi:hypothetical protein